jgi:hypothetical protein
MKCRTALNLSVIALAVYRGGQLFSSWPHVSVDMINRM